MVRTLATRSEEETVAAGRALAEHLAPGAIVLLVGDLGAGKTAFVRGMAAGLNANPADVSSPTFTLVQEYRGGRLPLYHADFYRITGEEADDLGLEELAEDGVLAIEWADRWERKMPGSVEVRITELGKNERAISVETGEDSARGERSPE